MTRALQSATSADLTGAIIIIIMSIIIDIFHIDTTRALQSATSADLAAEDRGGGWGWDETRAPPALKVERMRW